MIDAKMTIHGLMLLRLKVRFTLRVVTMQKLAIIKSQKKSGMSIMKILKRTKKRWIILSRK